MKLMQMKILPDNHKRVYGLDIFRAIAIILVVQSHGSFMLKGTPLEKFPWIRLIDGVELFFVLSGFLIGSILLKIIKRNNYQLNLKDILNFWKRRWIRTLPNYYLILFVNVLLVNYSIIGGDIQQFNYKFLLFLQNFSGPFHSFFWESWSLSIEEWFYIFLPLSLVLVLWFKPNKSGVLVAILMLMAAPLIYRIMHASESVDHFWWDVKFRKVILMRLDTIIYGVFAAYIKFYYQRYWEKYAWHTFIAGMILVLALPYIPKEPNDFYAKTFYFNLTTIGAMLLLPMADSLKSYKTIVGRVVTHISLISYSMYLINLALVVQVISKNFPIQNPMDGFMKYILYWGIVLVGSTLLYRYFEKPIMDLRDKKPGLKWKLLPIKSRVK